MQQGTDLVVAAAAFAARPPFVLPGFVATTIDALLPVSQHLFGPEEHFAVPDSYVVAVSGGSYPGVVMCLVVSSQKVLQGHEDQFLATKMPLDCSAVDSTCSACYQR